DVWQQYCIARFHYYDGRLRRRTVDSCGNSTCLKTPQNCSKEGQLKPFFANNVDIPFARARRLKPCPRKATVRSGKQSSAYDTVHKFHFKNNNLFGGTSNANVSDGMSKRNPSPCPDL